MAIHKIKKIAVDTTGPDLDIAGLKSSRYEKLQVSYGVISSVFSGTASISTSGVLTVGAVTSGALSSGTVVTGANVTVPVRVTALLTGSGGAGSTYQVLPNPVSNVNLAAVTGTSYGIDDTLVFADIPSQDIIRATIVAHATGAPAVLDIYPGSDNTGTYTLNLITTTALTTAPPKLSYVVEYIRGGGRVGDSAYKANAYATPQTALESGEGDLLKVKIAISGSALTAADAETQVSGD
jgi:hypothetical protein